MPEPVYRFALHRIRERHLKIYALSHGSRAPMPNSDPIAILTRLPIITAPRYAPSARPIAT